MGGMNRWQGEKSCEVETLISVISTSGNSGGEKGRAHREINSMSRRKQENM